MTEQENKFEAIINAIERADDVVAMAALARNGFAGDAVALARIEAAALCAMRARGARPFGVSDAVPGAAAGRAPKERYQPREMVTTTSGSRRVVNCGHRGLDGLRPVSPLQRIDAAAARAYRGDKATREPIFTTGQIDMADDYAALFERCQSAGVKCSSIEGLGAGGQGSFIDRVIADSRQLARWQLAVGDGVILAQRNPAAASGKVAIRCLDLVNAVCIAGQSCDTVLGRFGWSKATKHRTKLIIALRMALDRMRGFD